MSTPERASRARVSSRIPPTAAHSAPGRHRAPERGQGQRAEGDAEGLGHGRRPVEAGEAEEAHPQGQAGEWAEVARHRPGRQPRRSAHGHGAEEERQPQVEVGDRQAHGQEHGVQGSAGVVEVEVAEEQEALGPAEVDVGVGVGHPAADHPPPLARLPRREQRDAVRAHAPDQARRAPPPPQTRRQEQAAGGDPAPDDRDHDEGAQAQVQVLEQEGIELRHRLPDGGREPRRPQGQDEDSGRDRRRSDAPEETDPPVARRRR